LLIDSERFRTWLGVVGTDPEKRLQASAKVFDIYLDPPKEVDGYTKDELRAFRPYVSIDSGEDEAYTSVSIAAEADGSSQYMDSGSVVLEFHTNIPKTEIKHPRDGILQLRNDLGVMLAEMKALAGTSGTDQYVQVARFTVFGPIQVSALDDKGDVQVDDNLIAVMQVDWGELT